MAKRNPPSSPFPSSGRKKKPSGNVASGGGKKPSNKTKERPPRRMPSLHEVREFIADGGDMPPTAKQIAAAFGVHKADHKALRNLLRKLGDSKSNQHINKPNNNQNNHSDNSSSIKKRMRRNESTHPENKHTHPPSVSILEIIKTDADGELIATLAKWESVQEPPHILIPSHGIHKGLAPAVGDKVLANIEPIADEVNRYNATIIRIIPKASSKNILGILSHTQKGGIVEPVDRRDRNSYVVSAKNLDGAEEGELVEIQPLPNQRQMGAKSAKVLRRLGDTDHPSAASTIAIHQNDIPHIFSDEALSQAEASESPIMSNNRNDLRDIPLITIDGADARDFDDAVFAEPDDDATNKGGWHIMIAIADVSHYVTIGSVLDDEAKERGNSAYFPARVVPMLPEALSNGLCSLNPEVDRYCLAVHIWLDSHGNALRHKFVRGLMRSHARWTYETAQEAFNVGEAPDYLRNLYATYKSMKNHISSRNPLDLNLPEFKPAFNDGGEVIAINKVARLDAHKLIEAYMIAANVAAAETLEKKLQPAVYRVHETPDSAKLEVLKDLLKPSGYKFASNGQIHARMFNKLLHDSTERGEENIIHTAVLRSQMRAFYGTQNDGHFGLSLKSYTHFTSPIRRYSDLIVHRALIATHGFGNDGLSDINIGDLEQTAEHISDTERRAMKAERTAMDRYMAAYMSDRVGATFDAHISGITTAGFFLSLDENGADGFVPMRTLSDDYYIHDPKSQTLKGRRKGRIFKLGQAINVTLSETNPITGSLRFQLTDMQDDKSNRRKSTKRYKKR